MTRRAIDPKRLRVALRRVSRGDLLVIAERATELVPTPEPQRFRRTSSISTSRPGSCISSSILEALVLREHRQRAAGGTRRR
jgi:hypothetical protein